MQGNQPLSFVESPNDFVLHWVANSLIFCVMNEKKQPNESIDTITSKEWVIFTLSPFTLPILIGMMISKN